MPVESDNLRRLQRRYLIGAAAIAPLAPFLYLQGRLTRWKVGVLPEAAGTCEGASGIGEDEKHLLVIGESTAAGVGASTHDRALAGNFARSLSTHTGRVIRWHVVGRSGVTARRTIDELLPLVPACRFDHILLAIGGNDVMRLNSPRNWRRDMIELLGRLRERHPDAVIFISNCPMIIMSPVIPEPVKAIMWQLSRMHDANAREFTREMDRVFYYPQPVNVNPDGFFADGIHPSEKGYADWAEAMVSYFRENHKW